MRKSSRPRAVFFLRFSSSAPEHRTHAAIARHGGDKTPTLPGQRLLRKSDAAPLEMAPAFGCSSAGEEVAQFAAPGNKKP